MQPGKVTEAELAVLQVLWDQGECTIRDLTGELYPGGATSHYATVQKLLERLEGKGCARRRRGSGAHVFSAAVGRDEFLGQRLQDLADQLCEGSLAPLLSSLVRGRRLSAAERRELDELVEELERKRSQRRGK